MSPPLQVSLVTSPLEHAATPVVPPAFLRQVPRALPSHNAFVALPLQPLLPAVPAAQALPSLASAQLAWVMRPVVAQATGQLVLEPPDLTRQVPVLVAMFAVFEAVWKRQYPLAAVATILAEGAVTVAASPQAQAAVFLAVPTVSMHLVESALPVAQYLPVSQSFAAAH